jgi:hypothetical protein
MNLGPSELVILLVLVGFIAVPVWAVIDALRASDAEWAAAGQQRTLWVLLVGLGALCGGIVGTILAIVYLLTVRPKLLAARSAGP